VYAQGAVALTGLAEDCVLNALSLCFSILKGKLINFRSGNPRVAQRLN